MIHTAKADILNAGEVLNNVLVIIIAFGLSLLPSILLITKIINIVAKHVINI